MAHFIVLSKFLPSLKGQNQRDVKNRVLASPQAGQTKFRVYVLAWIPLSRDFAHGKRLDLFYDSGCQLALKNWVF